MPDLFAYLFAMGIVAQEVIRFPHRMRNKRDKREHRIADGRVGANEVALSVAGWTGMEIVPLLLAFTNWLDPYDYPLPSWTGWVGVPFLIAGLWLLRRSHTDLGRNWSPTLEINESHSLVTAGVYRYLRHPIYSAIGLFGVAQMLMLHNWVAGPAGLLSALLVYLCRIPQEERMMLDHFGEEYRLYMTRTGGILPSLRQTSTRPK